MVKYDYLIVGAGLYGITFAHEMHKAGAKVLVIDKRSHIGGNCYSEKIEGINVCKYGPHIFHTDVEWVWHYFSQFGKLIPYHHTVKAYHEGRYYSFPINLLTLNQVYGDMVKTPADAEKFLKSMNARSPAEPKNFEEYLISQIGQELYTMFFEWYTHKLWGVDPSELPVDFAKRLPIRCDFNDSYYDNRYVGMPENGYTKMFIRMLDGIDVQLDTEYQREIDYEHHNIVWTGRLDEFYNYKYGELEYRKIRFKDTVLHGEPDYQGCSVINYPDMETDILRRTEHKHFVDKNAESSVITEEQASVHGVSCYPIRNKVNLNKLTLYQIDFPEHVIFGGRLATFQYMNMDKVIEAAVKDSKLCVK